MFSGFRSQDGRAEFSLGARLYGQKKYSEAEGPLQQAADKQEKTLGRSHEKTLRSKHWLGRALCNQKKYSRAEEQLQQAAEGWEKTLGKDHEDTLSSKHSLGSVLYDQKKYIKAEEQLQQAAEGRERTLGKDHEDTLRSKHWLGCALYNQQKYSRAEELFQQAAERRKKTFGRGHEDTLSSKHWLGCALYSQQKYSRAEELFQQAAERRKKTLGRSHEKTLRSKHWLGRALCNQKKYSRAEEQLQQAAEGWEKTLGKDHEDTLSSKHWLGRALYAQQKYSRAEELFQQAAEGWKKTLGKDHEDTLSGKHWLGRALYAQQKYSRAEELFQQAAEGWERTFGRDDEETLRSKHWLGKVLCNQEKYSRAEEQLQQAAEGRERTLGRGHEETLRSQQWLGCVLYNQEKYSRAEEQLQQAAEGQEKSLGRDHEDTLRSKHWLGHALYDRQKYSKAEEQLQQAAEGRERTLGKDHKDTLATVHVLQELREKSPPHIVKTPTTQDALAGRLSAFFSDGQYDREPYSDSEICEISTLLKHLNPQWSKVPRTYIVLRTIDHLKFLDNLIDAGFSDYWFPVTERNLPGCLLPSIRAVFVRAQSVVLTKSVDLEKGKRGRHCYFKKGESPPFEPKKILGTGGFGQVDEVLSQISFKHYARKRVPRSAAFRGRRKEDIKQFIAEIEILKRLEHRHIVDFAGSYTDAKYIGLIMYPVADMDLAAYLARATASLYPELRTFFGCLANALEYLHEQKVRHKDIKPGNILVHAGNVLFTDFGLSLDFTGVSGSTTMSMVNGRTLRYCAPEVAQEQPRNTMSDIWSLGAVFMEMIVVLKGKPTQYMDEFYKQHGSWQAFINKSPTALTGLIAELEEIGSSTDNGALGWTQKMLSAEQQLRPTASSLIEFITTSSLEGTGFCGICCVPHEEQFSDWMDE